MMGYLLKRAGLGCKQTVAGVVFGVNQSERPHCLPSHSMSFHSLTRAATRCGLGIAFALAARSHAGVVISEIMYRPGSTYPENTALEYIELHNTDAAPADISGWAITSGTSFTFPPLTSIPPGGYLVVASNPTAVQGAHGIAGVFGPWAAGTALANGGEKVTISKPGAAPGTWDAVDSVTYANEGDWGSRVRETVFGGWAWTSAADAGKSLELRNAAISNDNGQNWAASTAPSGGTPGAANSVATANVPPIIHDVKHSPAIPTSAQDVIISCDTNDETAPAGRSATLFWRDATSTNPGSFQSLAMGGDGSGRFSATLAPRNNLAIVEFYVAVSDGVNTRTWPAPTNEGQNANCQYQVNNEPFGNDNYYFLVLTAAENAAFNAVNSSSDRVFNQTFIARNGSDTTIRYRSGMRIRGNSSRTYQFRPLRITIPNDHDLDGYTSFNLNPRAPHLQFLGQRMLQAGGIRASDSAPVELRRNGVEQTTSSGGTPDFGKWARVEDEGGDFVKRHWPAGQNGGNYYKKIDNGGPLNYYWRSSGWTVPTDPETVMDGYAKQGNRAANDWTDLTAFFTVLQAAAAPHFPGSSPTDVAGSNGTRISGPGNWNGTAFSAGEITAIETVADLDQWARWFAAMTILQSIETNISNGVDDDYGLVFMPVGAERKLQFVAHDLDTIFGLGDTPTAYNGRGLYDMGDDGQVFRTLLPLLGNNSDAGNAAFRTKYHVALRELFGAALNADTTGNPNPPFYQFVDNHLAGWAPTGTLSAIKTFATQRQAYLLDLIPDGVVGGSVATPITPAAATSTSSTTSVPSGVLVISEVLADNVAAVNIGGAFPDIIEIHNISGATVDLGGMTLSDDATVGKYSFPAGTMLAADGYLTIIADGTVIAGHAPFSVDSGGESLFLRAAPGDGGALLDSVTFGHLPSDHTLGRTGPGAQTWTLCTPTLGSANTAVAGFASPAGLRINEFAGRADYLIEDDFLEIYNSATLPVAMGGMSITDDTINAPTKHVMPLLSFVGPASFTRFKAKGGSATPGVSTELAFKIDANFGHVALLGQNGTVVDRQDIIAQAADTSVGRSPNGAAAMVTFGLPADVPTPGASNVAPPASVLALLNGLRISELLYAPNGLEYIELHNIGATALDLTGVHFTRGVTYTFTGGTLAPGAFIVVCRDRTTFLAQFPATPLAPGQFTGSLDNAGETIALQPPAPWDVNILKFSYSPNWFAPATDNGYSLVVIDDISTPARDWGDKSTWTVSTNLYGTPGSGPPPTITSAGLASGVLGDPFSYQITATQLPTSFGATGLPDGLSVNTASGLISGTATVSGTFNVVVSATNTSGSGMKALTLTISSSGPISTFVWSNIANQQAGTPFTATFTAKDSANRTVTSFNGNATLIGQGTGTSVGIVLITETSSGSADYFEIENVGNAAASTAGWFIIPNNANGSGGGVSAVNAAWPLPASVAAGAVTAVTENTQGVYPTTIDWGAGGNPNGWCMLCDNTGAVRDFIAWGYSSAQIASINIPSITVGGTTYTNITVPSAQWSGNGMPSGNFLSYIHTRSGTSDHNDSSDWALTGTDESNKGVHNPGLSVPFVAPPTSYPVIPSAVSLVNGVFTGSLTLNNIVTGVRLIANDGAGHTGQSNSFNLTGPPPPVITSPLSAIAAQGSPFSYQIVATNSPISYSAVGLPAGLSVNTTTGLISGTPTQAGFFNVTIGAANPGGTGTLVLSINVQADTDADGMGDAWETAHGLAVGVNDGALDRDGDGQGNFAEWLAGTLPEDATSRFRIIGTTIAGADVTITWSSFRGRRYRVMTAASLTGAWTNLTPTPLVASTTTASFTHVGGASQSANYYRVEIVP
jgi:hypothetical protein